VKDPHQYEYKMRRYEDPRGRTSNLLRNARANAKREGARCTLTFEWILERILAGKCEVTRLPFELKRSKIYRAHPFSPSLDRRAAGGDYSPENTRVVVYALNLLRNEYPDMVTRRVARAWLDSKET